MLNSLFCVWEMQDYILPQLADGRFHSPVILNWQKTMTCYRKCKGSDMLKQKNSRRHDIIRKTIIHYLLRPAKFLSRFRHTYPLHHRVVPPRNMLLSASWKARQRVSWLTRKICCKNTLKKCMQQDHVLEENSYFLGNNQKNKLKLVE